MFERVAERHGLPMLSGFFALGANNRFFADLRATCLVVAALSLKPLQRALSVAPAAFLGRVSFPLYLIDVPLLYTIFAYGYGAVPLPVLFMLFLGTALGLAWLFEVGIDAPTVRSLKTWPARIALPSRRSAPDSVA